MVFEGERVLCRADELHAHEALDEMLVAEALMKVEWVS